MILSLRDVDRRNPINRRHRLNRLKSSWWLGLPGLCGGPAYRDLAGQRHGAITAAAWQPATRRGGHGELKFNGTSASVAMATAGLPSGTGPTTHALWFKQLGTAGTQMLLFHGANGSGQARQIYLNFVSGTTAQLVADTNAGGTLNGPTLTSNTWNHVAVTFDGVNQSLYVNGLPAVGPSAASPNISTSAFSLGARAAALWFNGVMDDVFVAPWAMTAAQVWSLYALSLLGYPYLLNRTGARSPSLGVSVLRSLMLLGVGA